MIALNRKQRVLLSCIVFLTALLVQGCPPPTSYPTPTAQIAPSGGTEQPGRAEPTYQLALNPSKKELSPGEQVVLSAVPLGREQMLPNLRWSLEPAPGDEGKSPGELSSDSGPSVLYTAPNASPVSVIVTATRPETGESYRIMFLVTISGSWAGLPGLATDIGVGADGSVWITGTNSVQGGFGIYTWNGKGWSAVEGGAVNVAVDPKGVPWVVNEMGDIFRREGNDWQRLPGLATDIGVGADGSVWITGTNPVQGGFGIYTWNGEGWSAVEGGAVRVAVDPKGMPWAVNANGNIYERVTG